MKESDKKGWCLEGEEGNRDIKIIRQEEYKKSTSGEKKERRECRSFHTQATDTQEISYPSQREREREREWGRKEGSELGQEENGGNTGGDE